MATKTKWRTRLFSVGFVLVFLLAAAGVMQLAPMTPSIVGADPVAPATITRQSDLVARFDFNDSDNALANSVAGSTVALGVGAAHTVVPTDAGPNSVHGSIEGDGALRGTGTASRMVVNNLPSVDFSAGFTLTAWVNLSGALAAGSTPFNVHLMQFNSASTDINRGGAHSSGHTSINFTAALIAELRELGAPGAWFRGSATGTGAYGFAYQGAHATWFHVAIGVGTDGGVFYRVHGVDGRTGAVISENRTHGNATYGGATNNMGDVVRDMLDASDFNISFADNYFAHTSAGNNNNRMFDDIRIYNVPLSAGETTAVRNEHAAAHAVSFLVNGDQTLYAAGYPNRQIVVPLPTGTDITAVVPTLAHGGATAYVNLGDGQTATVTVTNGPFERTYTLNVVPLDPVDGITAIRFRRDATDTWQYVPDVSFLSSSYTVQLPVDFLAPPQVEAIFVADDTVLDVEITPAANFIFDGNGNGTAEFSITATEIGTSPAVDRTFAVTFVRNAGPAFLLDTVGLNEGGVESDVHWFRNSATPYFINRSAGTTVIPQISYTTAVDSAVQTVVVTQATGWGASNAATIEVTDTVSNVTRTYTFVMQHLTNARIIADFSFRSQNGDGQFYDSTGEYDTTRVMAATPAATAPGAAPPGGPQHIPQFSPEMGAARFNRHSAMAVPASVFADDNWINQHELTFSFWMNATDTNVEPWRAMFGARSITPAGGEFMIGPNLWSSMSMGGTGDNQLAGGRNMVNGAWNNVLVSINRQEATFYANGEWIGSFATGSSPQNPFGGGIYNWDAFLSGLANPASTSQVWLGRNFAGNERGTHWFNGYMRDFRMWDMALTPELVQEYLASRLLARPTNITVTGAGANLQSFSPTTFDYTVHFDVDAITALPTITPVFSAASTAAGADFDIEWLNAAGDVVAPPAHTALGGMRARVTTTAPGLDSFVYTITFVAASANLNPSTIRVRTTATGDWVELSSFDPERDTFFFPWENATPAGVAGLAFDMSPEANAAHILPVATVSLAATGGRGIQWTLATPLYGVPNRVIRVILVPAATYNNVGLGALTINGNAVTMEGNSLVFDVGAATTAPEITLASAVSNINIGGVLGVIPAAQGISISELTTPTGQVTITVTALSGATATYTITFVTRTALDQAVALANARVEANYTVESWAPFASARTAAQGTFNTQAEIDAALAALTTAQNNLVAVTPPVVEDPNGGCGSASVLGGLLAISVLAGVGALFVKKRS